MCKDVTVENFDIKKYFVLVCGLYETNHDF